MTCIVLFISHIEPVVYSPILPARQPGPSVLEPTTESGRGRHAFGRSTWRLDSPGGSLRAGRPAAVCSRVHSGGQRRFHRQAAPESDPASAPNGPCPAPADQRLGSASVGGTTSRCSAPWLGRAQRKLAVQLQPLSDRLASQKVAQAYGLLVPATNKSVPSSLNQPETHHEQVSRNLRTSVLGSTEGGQDHRQSDDQPAGVRPSARLHSAV